MPKKITFQASKTFVSLYEKTEEMKKRILEELSKYIGYAPEWCEKHFDKIKHFLQEEEEEDEEDQDIEDIEGDQEEAPDKKKIDP